MNNNFTPLEPGASSLLGNSSSFTIGQVDGSVDLGSLLVRPMIFACVLALIFMLGYAYVKRLAIIGEASDSNIVASKKIAFQAIYAFIITISLTLISSTANPILSISNIGLSGLTSSVLGGQGVITNPGTNVSCPNVDSFKSNLNSGVNICEGFTCNATIGCDTQTYASIILQESVKQGINPKLVTVIMCKESKGNKNAVNTKNTTGGVDCGLMQINKNNSTTCSSEDLDPVKNIIKGISKIKEKYNSINQTYPSIDKEMMVAASYNCCGGGDNPNSSSVDCNTSSGFPYTLPKWGCPINPGPTNANMCSVRGYVCDISACFKQLKQ